MSSIEAVEEAATALGLGYLTPDQRKILLNLWERGHHSGWLQGYDAAEDY